MPIMFNNGVLLIKPAGVAMDPACCCGAKCYCIQQLPNTLYLTVDFCGTNVIELTLYDEFISNDKGSCIKYYSGSGTFGAGPGIGFFRVAIGADSDPASFFLKYCFDGCTTGECVDPTNTSLWPPFNSIDCEPLYGEITSAAPPSACGGSCIDPWTLVITE